MDATTLMELRRELARAASVYRRRQTVPRAKRWPPQPKSWSGRWLGSRPKMASRSGSPSSTRATGRQSDRMRSAWTERFRCFAKCWRTAPWRAVLSVRNDETGGHDDFEIKTLVAMGYVSLTEFEDRYGLEG